MRSPVGWFLVFFLLFGQSFAAQTRHRKKAAAKPAPKPPVACVTCNMKVVPDLDERLAKWKPVNMPFHSDGLSPREIKLVHKLVDATRYLEDIYWRQSDPEALTLFQKLAGSRHDEDVK